MKNMVLLCSTSVENDSNIVPSLIFSHFFILVGFFGLSFLFGLLWPLLFFIKSGDSSRLVGESLLPSSFPHMGQCSNNEDDHTFIYLQLKNYNSILTTKYDYMNASGGVPGCAMNQE